MTTQKKPDLPTRKALEEIMELSEVSGALQDFQAYADHLEKRINMSYRQNTTVVWAKGNLRIMADMLEDRGHEWFAKETRRIADGLMLLGASNE